jgi:predicted ATPase
MQRYFREYQKVDTDNLFDEKIFQDEGKQFPEQELLVHGLVPRNPFFARFNSALSRFQIYQISPNSSRTPGVPTQNPRLSTSGENLPALVDWLQTNHKELWEVVMASMIDILPKLTEISIEYLYTRTLGLRFTEEGVGRPWSTYEVSDGTIQSLALLVASVDPRSSCLLIEEPENSVHPWIIRTLVNRFRLVSEFKNVILTSHSPVLLDLLKPEEIWISSRQNGETELKRLTDIDPDISKQWENGEYRISEFLDAGFVPQAVPGGVL